MSQRGQASLHCALPGGCVQDVLSQLRAGKGGFPALAVASSAELPAILVLVLQCWAGAANPEVPVTWPGLRPSPAKDFAR